MVLRGYKLISVHIEGRLRALGFEDVSISTGQIRKWVHRKTDPLPVRHFAGGNYANERDLDEWVKRQHGRAQIRPRVRAVREAAEGIVGLLVGGAG